jgi:hypothetical protein
MGVLRSGTWARCEARRIPVGPVYYSIETVNVPSYYIFVRYLLDRIAHLNSLRHRDIMLGINPFW